MTVENPTLSDLVYEIEKEVVALKIAADAERWEEEQCIGSSAAHRACGKARAYEVEADRLAAILAKYQAVTALQEHYGKEESR